MTNPNNPDRDPSPDDKVHKILSEVAHYIGPQGAQELFDTNLFGDDGFWRRLAAVALKGDGEQGRGVVLILPTHTEDEYAITFVSEDCVYEHMQGEGVGEPFGIPYDDVDRLEKELRRLDPEETVTVVVEADPPRIYHWSFEPSPPKAYAWALDQGLFDD